MDLYSIFVRSAKKSLKKQLTKQVNHANNKNMREIKFRAWDKENGKMIFNPLITDINSASNYIGLNDLPGKFNDNFIELMQYTGLKDKNGGEIYEGDIVKIYDDFGKDELLIDSVISVPGGFMLKDWDSEYGWPNTEDSVEIIGNIYENPELLSK